MINGLDWAPSAQDARIAEVSRANPVAVGAPCFTRRALRPGALRGATAPWQHLTLWLSAAVQLQEAGHPSMAKHFRKVVVGNGAFNSLSALDCVSICFLEDIYYARP